MANLNIVVGKCHLDVLFLMFLLLSPLLARLGLPELKELSKDPSFVLQCSHWLKTKVAEPQHLCGNSS